MSSLDASHPRAPATGFFSLSPETYSANTVSTASYKAKVYDHAHFTLGL
jgi:hypothetical protein